jgi:uncharacterized repeat protein (TIGR02543 family)
MVTHGSDAEIPGTPKRTGYTFVGWKGTTTFIQSNETVQATYDILTLSVRFNDHNGELLKQELVEYGASVKPPQVQREGYDFTGWSQATENITENLVINPNYVIQTFTVTFQDYDGFILKTDEIPYKGAALPPIRPNRDGFIFIGWNQPFDEIIRNTTVQAQYSEAVLLVTFRDYDNRVIKTIEVDYGTSALEPEAPSREGHLFVGWNESIETITESKTVLAEYERLSYDVVFKDFDGTIIDTYKVKYGDTSPLPDDPSREGYIFLGWDDYTSISRPKEIFARYTIDNRQKITFETFGGSDVEYQLIEPGDKVKEPNPPTKQGYTFDGWFLSSSGTEASGQTWDFDEFTVDSGTMIYAKWIPNPYTVFFEVNGGENIDEIELEFGDAINIIPTKSGYIFSGWFLDKEFNNSVEKNGLPARNVTVYAKWMKDPINIKVQANNGAPITSMMIEKGSRLNPDPVTKEGHAFEGWYLDSEFKSPLNPENTFSSEITLYAKWSVNIYTVSYRSHDETIILNVTYNSIVPGVELNPLTGHAFSGWSPEVPEVMPALDLELEATFEPLKMNVQLNNENNTKFYTTSVDYGTRFEDLELPSPTKLGHTFDKWQNAPETINEDLILKPSFIVNTYSVTFKDYDGSIIANYTVEHGNDSPQPVVQDRKGYVFDGWNSSYKSIMKDLVLVAKYSYSIEEIELNLTDINQPSQELFFNSGTNPKITFKVIDMAVDDEGSIILVGDTISDRDPYVREELKQYQTQQCSEPSPEGYQSCVLNFQLAIIMKLDSNYNVLWYHTYGGEGQDFYNSVIINDDGSIIAGGTSSSEEGDLSNRGELGKNPNLNQDFYDSRVVFFNHFDKDGRLIKTLYHGAEFGGTMLGDMIKTSSGKIVATGSKNGPGGTMNRHIGSWDIFVLGFDQNLNVTDNLVYGGTNFELANKILERDNSNLIIVGVTESSNVDFRELSNPKQDILILELYGDLSGISNLSSYGDNSFNRFNGYRPYRVNDALIFNDDYLVVAGMAYDFHEGDGQNNEFGWEGNLVAIDFNGNKIWEVFEEYKPESALNHTSQFTSVVYSPIHGSFIVTTTNQENSLFFYNRDGERIYETNISGCYPGGCASYGFIMNINETWYIGGNGLLSIRKYD